MKYFLTSMKQMQMAIPRVTNSIRRFMLPGYCSKQMSLLRQDLNKFNNGKGINYEVIKYIDPETNLVSVKGFKCMLVFGVTFQVSYHSRDTFSLHGYRMDFIDKLKISTAWLQLATEFEKVANEGERINWAGVHNPDTDECLVMGCIPNQNLVITIRPF